MGRTGIFEFWRVSDDDYLAILNHKDEHALRCALADRDHRFLLADGLAKVAAGVTSILEIRRASGAGFSVRRSETALRAVG